MLAYHRKPVYLSFSSIDLPIWSTIETTAFLYQKDKEKFHLLLHQQDRARSNLEWQSYQSIATTTKKELMWLELTPSRVVMTMQGKGKMSYRHFWEEGVYGVSRYLLDGDSIEQSTSFRLRNYTKSLHLERNPLPTNLRIEYELWTAKVQLGSYVMHLDIHH
ncbi:MAG: hypothetical protein ACRC2R_02805 [Xenococcaceae cyanobacterium]